MSIIFRNNEIIIIKNHLNYKDKLNNLKQFLWQPETRQVLGRTKESWCKICCFYICFYTALGCIFTASVAVYLASLDYRFPKYYGDTSVLSRQRIDNEIIGVHPGMGFRPLPEDQTALIRVRSSANKLDHPHNYVKYVQQLDKYLEYYIGEEVFLFGQDTPCTSRRNYEYDRAKPCILLKLNRIYNWIPVAYEPTDSLPNELKPFENLVREYPLYIYVLCEGENQVDKDLIGKIKYYSKTPNGPGGADIGFIEFASYPWILQDDYYTPLIFAYFSNLTTNVLVNVMCKAFAKNIHINTLYRVGSVHFELFIE
jgi:sodium/potassium-transporting ATPase subunit beta